MNIALKVALFGSFMSMLVSCSQFNTPTSQNQFFQPQASPTVEIHEVLDINVTLNHTHRSIKDMVIFQDGAYKVISHYGAHSIWVGITNSTRSTKVPYVSVSSSDEKIVSIKEIRHVFTNSDGFTVYEIVFDTPIDTAPKRADFGTSTITLTAFDESGGRHVRFFRFTTKPDPEPSLAYCPTPPNCPERPDLP